MSYKTYFRAVSNHNVLQYHLNKGGQKRKPMDIYILLQRRKIQSFSSTSYGGVKNNVFRPGES